MDLAGQFIDLAIKYAAQRKIRIDVLYWDLEDSRHKIQGREDKSNLERMYYKVIRHVINQWGQSKLCEWELYPDAGSNLDWAAISNYLKNTKIGRRKQIADIPLFREFAKDGYPINIISVSPKNSQDEPLIQLADLFAGMAKFSKEKGTEYINWVNSEESKKYAGFSFTFENENEISSSKKDIARFTILSKLDKLCKEHRMRVSIKTHKYLTTKDPTGPINFWFYEPQTEKDKAPTKRGGLI